MHLQKSNSLHLQEINSSHLQKPNSLHLQKLSFLHIKKYFSLFLMTLLMGTLLLTGCIEPKWTILSKKEHDLLLEKRLKQYKFFVGNLEYPQKNILRLVNKGLEIFVIGLQ